MQMTALVLVGSEMSGCVCQPIPTSGAIAPAGTAGTAVAAEAVLEVERRRRVAAAAAARRSSTTR